MLLLTGQERFHLDFGGRAETLRARCNHGVSICVAIPGSDLWTELTSVLSEAWMGHGGGERPWALVPGRPGQQEPCDLGQVTLFLCEMGCED